MRQLVAILSAAACAWLTGCGASHTSASHTTTAGTTSTSSAAVVTTTLAATSAPPRAGILARVLTDNELKGFTGTPDGVDTSARTWLASQQSPDVNADDARLRRLGFIRGVREDLSAGGTPGLSDVQQFHSAKAASAELLAEIAEVKSGSGGVYKAFTVSGIAGAHGYTLTQGGQGGVNLAFVKGPYYYLVGQELAPSESIAAAIARITAAAQHLSHRVNP